MKTLSTFISEKLFVKGKDNEGYLGILVNYLVKNIFRIGNITHNSFSTKYINKLKLYGIHSDKYLYHKTTFDDLHLDSLPIDLDIQFKEAEGFAAQLDKGTYTVINNENNVYIDFTIGRDEYINLIYVSENIYKMLIHYNDKK